MTTSMTSQSHATPANDVRETLSYAVGQSILGSVLVASSTKGVVGILIGDDPGALVEDLKAGFPHAALAAADAGDDRLVDRVVSRIEDPSIGFDLPLDVRGTAYQQKVWKALQAIPAGQTTTYTALAVRLGDPNAARAVASACAANKLAVVIPCHRVVRSDGSLSGYRWGVQRKQALIEREAASARKTA